MIDLGKKIFFCLFILTALWSCEDTGPVPVDEDQASGGETTVYGNYISIFQQPAANLTSEELELHRQADVAFGDQFVTSPALINAGLGPLFNQNSCESCHLSNGRSPFPSSRDDLRGLLIRLSVVGEGDHGQPLGIPGYGGQLQTKAVFGKAREAEVTWNEELHEEFYSDGESITLSRPVFHLDNPYFDLPSDMMISPRMASPVFGLGLLEAIEDADLLSIADPNDQNGDGISGRPNMVWDVVNQKQSIGRFGWKAGNPTLLQQTAGAYNGDMGITSPLFPDENCFGQLQCDSLTDDPEIDLDVVKTAAFYTQSLAVPGRRNTDDETVMRGKELFANINCSSCHIPSFATGNHEFAFLSNQRIFPYTDLLLHDMGEGLADHRPEFMADGREWRTAPLWGIGLTHVVGGHSRFLHDGRARNLEEAIMWHGGEAQRSRDEFKALSAPDREALISFLESL
jgi:CxxC motif-containing protein (DUF1111 family)